jgi:ADP-glucose pyrophosphorylase
MKNVFDGYWEDIGTIKSFFEANLDFASTVPQFNFYDEVNPIYTRVRFLPGSKMRNIILDKNVRVGDHTVIDYKGDPTIRKNCGAYHIVDGIVVVPKNSEIPPNTKIE